MGDKPQLVYQPHNTPEKSSIAVDIIFDVKTGLSKEALPSECLLTVKKETAGNKFREGWPVQLHQKMGNADSESWWDGSHD